MSYNEDQLDGMRIHCGDDEKTVYQLVYAGRVASFTFQAYRQDAKGNLRRWWYDTKTCSEVNREFDKGRIKKA